LVVPLVALQPPEVDQQVLQRQVEPLLPVQVLPFQAPDPLKPTGKWATEADTLKVFKASREKYIDWVKKTPEKDLRAHVQTSPLGIELDAHEWMLFMVGHTARHTKQIEEVKADPNFPKS